MPARPLSLAWQELAKQHSPLPQEHYDLVVGEDFYQFMTHNADQRNSEVALVVRRPDGLLLLHTKPFYPPETWRIPTGGVERGETIGNALHREMAEETSLPADENRLLGILTYAIQTTGGRSLHFASAIFLVAVPNLPPAKQDPREQISGYRWAPVQDLPLIAAQLEHLVSDWADWGRFRALAHRFAARVLFA